MPAVMNKQQPTKKTVHALESPYTDPEWPALSLPIESRILDALLPLLSPVGQYRDKHVPCSKGRKRKRNNKQNDSQQLSEEKHGANVEGLGIQKHLTVGFNTTVRKLESLAPKVQSVEQTEHSQTPEKHGLFVVFVCLSSLPSVMTAPLPLLAATATLSAGGSFDVRLVPISQQSSDKVAGALKQPTVSVLGLSTGAPGTEALCDLVRANIQSVAVPWIKHSGSATYVPVKIHTETVTAKAKSRKEKRKRSTQKTS